MSTTQPGVPFSIGGPYYIRYIIWPHRIWTRGPFSMGFIFYETYRKWTPIDYGRGSIFYGGPCSMVHIG